MVRLSLVLVVLSGTPVCFGQIPPTPKSIDGKAVKVPRLVVAERVKELGGVMAGDVVPVEWTLENQGDADLNIERTVASCGCTVVHLTDAQRVIPPGGRMNLAAEFRSVGRKGQQIKSVIVHSNDPTTPEMELRFQARVDELFVMNPPQRWVLRGVRRGESPSETLDIVPGEGRGRIDLVEAKIADPGLFDMKSELLHTTGGDGHRFRLTVMDNAPLGNLTSALSLKLKIGGAEKDVVVPIHAEVVVDLTTQPRQINPPSQPLPRGQRLAPVAVRSLDQTPFEIRSAKAGDLLDVAVEAVAEKPAKTEYVVLLTVRNQAPSGPFGTTLEIRTSSFLQPVLRVPVFGLVAEPLEIDPPVVILRQDGTPAGSQRRVRVQVLPPAVLDIASLRSDNPAVTVATAATHGARMDYVEYLDVKLTGTMPRGTHSAVVTFTTNLAGAELVELPVSIEVP